MVSCHCKAFAVCMQHNGLVCGGVWGDCTGTWQNSISTCVQGTSGVLRVQEGKERHGQLLRSMLQHCASHLG